MKAIAFTQSLPIDHPDALQEIELPIPTPEAHDIRVAVSAISVNPVDAKVRNSALPKTGEPRVLGYDAVGIVDAVGSAVTRFQPGDRVWYAGNVARQGSNAEFQLVDERIASLAPKSLSDTEAAALPLTAITAWELLFDRLELGMRDTQGKSLLVIGAAGGVGSILVQLAKQLTDITVIGTASRPESQSWVKSLGADAVIDHHQPDLIINSAAYTKVDQAEDEPKLAFQINRDAPKVMADKAREYHIPFIHFSTDYVFDGEKEGAYVEMDPTNPLGIYGQSKCAGEEAVKAVDGQIYIFRTSWVYSNRGQNFYLTMKRLSHERDEIKVVSDQIGVPTSSTFIAKQIEKMIVERLCKTNYW